MGSWAKGVWLPVLTACCSLNSWQTHSSREDPAQGPLGRWLSGGRLSSAANHCVSCHSASRILMTSNAQCPAAGHSRRLPQPLPPGPSQLPHQLFFLFSSSSLSISHLLPSPLHLFLFLPPSLIHDPLPPPPFPPPPLVLFHILLLQLHPYFSSSSSSSSSLKRVFTISTSDGPTAPLALSLGSGGRCRWTASLSDGSSALIKISACCRGGR